MRRVSVDIGGTFTDCFVVWDGKYIEAKALTTHHNLALGFNEALGKACHVLDLDLESILSEVDSVRYATTLGTNALIEHKGPKIGMLVTAGFEATVPLSRARGYGEGLDNMGQQDMPNARRPDPLVLPHMICGVRERVDFQGKLVMPLDEDDVRTQIRTLVDKGAEIIVVALVNAVVNPDHEQRIEEILLEEYPSHLLGAIPVILSHQVAGRKGEYVRATSAIVDGYLHNTMYHALSALEQNLRAHRYETQLRRHGPAQLHRRAADHPLRPGFRYRCVRASGHAGRPRQRGGHRHGRHQLRHRHRRRGRHQALRLQPGDRPLAGVCADGAPRHPGRRRWLGGQL